MKIYPNNKTACFTVQLAYEIDLRTVRWEVVLCEFLGSPLDVGTFKPALVVRDTHSLIFAL